MNTLYKALLAIIISTALGIYIGVSQRNDLLLNFTGARIEGAVTGVSELINKRPVSNEGDYRVEYSFEIQGKTYAGHTVVAPVKKPAVGNRTQIDYLKDNPQVSTLADSHSHSVVRLLIILAVLGLWGAFTLAKWLLGKR